MTRRVLEWMAWMQNDDKNFRMADKLDEFLTGLRDKINAEIRSQMPLMFSALGSDIPTLRKKSSSPDEIAKVDGLEAKFNMFKSFLINSGKWTWNCDFKADTTHTQAAPPAGTPASATYACPGSPAVSTCAQGPPPSEPGSPHTTFTTSSTPGGNTPFCSPDQVMSCTQVGLGEHAFPTCACVVTQEPASLTSMTEIATSSAATTTSSCPPDQFFSCGHTVRGPHTYSSCGCVSTQPFTATAFQTTFVTVYQCPSGWASSCVDVGLSLQRLPSCACVMATATSKPPQSIPPPPLPEAPPLVPQSPEAGMMSVPDFVTTCKDLRAPLASYTLCPRDQSWVKVAEYSSVTGNEGDEERKT